METFRSLRVDVTGAVARVTLARPDVRNAFDETLVAEITRAFTALDTSPDARAVILEAEGDVFCAGADLTWMTRMAALPREANVEDACRLEAALSAVERCRRPVIARVQGHAFGGGAGLAAAADIVIAAEGALFGFTEVRLGLAPAVIAPFVLRRVGERAARRYFLTAERFTARKALEMGLVHEVTPPGGLDAACDTVTAAILRGAPGAIAAAKDLVLRLRTEGEEEARRLTTGLIAGLRASEEGQEGMAAFLGKRDPAWVRRGGPA